MKRVSQEFIPLGIEKKQQCRTAAKAKSGVTNEPGGWWRLIGTAELGTVLQWYARKVNEKRRSFAGVVGRTSAGV